MIRRHSGRTIPTALLVLLAAVMLWSLPGLAAEEQPAAETASQPPPVADYSKPLGPPDRLNRGTPRGMLYGYITAARASDYERAAEFLDLRRLSPDLVNSGPQLARQFKAFLDQVLWVDFSTLSDSNDGFADDGLPAWQDRLGEIQTEQGVVTLLLQRVPRAEDDVRIWKIAAATVAQTPELYAEFGPAWLETVLPAVFFDVQVFDLELWQWLGLIALFGAAALFSLLFAGLTARILGLVYTRGDRVLDARIVELVQGPIRLAITVLSPSASASSGSTSPRSRRCASSSDCSSSWR